MTKARKPDEAPLARAARDNPELPSAFVADTLQGRAESTAEQTTPYSLEGKPMTVAELIAELGRFSPDARVVVPHFYGGFSDLASVYAEPIRRAARASMADAAHEGADALVDGPFVADETAIVLDTAGRRSE
ncbi:hypothetical protein WJ542_07695 [Paraburkholderia sp. B3]|uniref:hypothetical protein n=1 Tax=Paraburkholderia sp. B3 TaxID=3134791 RepID=UPI003981EB23